MTIISANWADALDPVVQFRVNDGFARRPSMIPMLFNVQTSMNSDEEVTSIGAISPDAWDNYENAGVVSQADLDQGYKATFTHREYALEVAIQRKLIDDNKINMVNRMLTRFGDSAAVKREADAASVFNNAFTAATGPDGLALCSDSHPVSPEKTGVTQDNSFALALSADNVATVREAMMAFKDDAGSPLAVTPDTLLVPPALGDTARVIVGSMGQVDSANNNMNPHMNRMQVLEWHWLTDSNAWFMIDSNLMKLAGLEWFNRVPLSITPKVEDKTIRATWIAYMRYSFGWSDWKWVAGSNPS